MSNANPINETDRLSISINSQFKHFIHLVSEDGQQYKPLMNRENFPIESGPAIRMITVERAQKTISRTLLVNGREILPEDYVVLWRNVRVVTVEEAAKQLGLTFRFEAKLDLDICRSEKWYFRSIDSTLQDFEAFYQKYKRCIDEATGRLSILLESNQTAADVVFFLQNHRYAGNDKQLAEPEILIDLDKALISTESAIVKKQFDLFNSEVTA